MLTGHLTVERFSPSKIRRWFSCGIWRWSERSVHCKTETRGNKVINGKYRQFLFVLCCICLRLFRMKSREHHMTRFEVSRDQAETGPWDRNVVCSVFERFYFSKLLDKRIRLYHFLTYILNKITVLIYNFISSDRKNYVKNPSVNWN